MNEMERGDFTRRLVSYQGFKSAVPTHTYFTHTQSFVYSKQRQSHLQMGAFSRRPRRQMFHPDKELKKPRETDTVQEFLITFPWVEWTGCSVYSMNSRPLLRKITPHVQINDTDLKIKKNNIYSI